MTNKSFRTPKFLYGTAWKEEKSEALTVKALEAGFEGIDTANQRKHYNEEGVGVGFNKFLKNSGKKREEFFLQTKFTFARGQDHRKPYDENSAYPDQVFQSFASSLEHFNTEYLDSFILHGPFQNFGISDEDLEVWSAMENLLDQKRTLAIGVSNVGLDQLKTLFSKSRIKPKFVQNRCYASRQWDYEVRNFCLQNDIIYQGFSLLTANVAFLGSPPILALAKKYKKTIPQITFRFAHQIGMLPLTGTSDQNHMKEDLEIFDFELEDSELKIIEAPEQLASSGAKVR